MFKIDIFSKKLDFLIMKYFDGINFIACGECPEYFEIQKNRFFDGYYGIQYNHSGLMDFAVRGETRTQVEGAYAFISQPKLKFYYGAPAGTSRHHLFVCFKGTRVDRFIRDGLLVLSSPQPLIKIVNSTRFLDSMRELIENIRHNPPQNYNRAVLLLEDLLLQLHEQPTGKPEINSHLLPGLKQLLFMMTQNPELEWDFGREAAALGISCPHFRRIFRQYSGTAPKNYLIKCRLRNAVRMLLHSDDQIRVIAENCGIPDEFYFSRLFKKYYNLSPLTYRQEFKTQ